MEPAMSSGIDFFFVRPRYSGAVLADYSAYDGRNLSRARCSEQCVVLAASKATHIHQVHVLSTHMQQVWA